MASMQEQIWDLEKRVEQLEEEIRTKANIADITDITEVKEDDQT